MSQSPIAPRRILVVEDAPVIALALQDMLVDLGYEVVGPSGNMGVALELAAAEPLDAAVIDINIRGGKIYSVARSLDARHIPFLLVSGYADRSLPPDLIDRPRLEKPYTQEALQRQLDMLLRP